MIWFNLGRISIIMSFWQCIVACLFERWLGVQLRAGSGERVHGQAGVAVEEGVFRGLVITHRVQVDSSLWEERKESNIEGGRSSVSISKPQNDHHENEKPIKPKTIPAVTKSKKAWMNWRGERHTVQMRMPGRVKFCSLTMVLVSTGLRYAFTHRAIWQTTNDDGMNKQNKTKNGVRTGWNHRMGWGIKSMNVSNTRRILKRLDFRHIGVLQGKHMLRVQQK